MFVTLCNKDYLIGFEVMLKSLIENNPRIQAENIPFLIISNDLNEDDLMVSKKMHENIKIKNYNKEKYEKINESASGLTLFGDYSKYEIFSIADVDKMIFLDCDTLIVGNIDYLIDFEGDFGAVRDLYIDQYNTGVMVISKKYLNENITNDLINLTGILGPTEHMDQDIINNYFIDDIIEIPISYNFLKTYHKPMFVNSPLCKTY